MEACTSYMASQWWFLAGTTLMEVEKKGFGYGQRLASQQERRGCAYCLAVVQTSDYEFKVGVVVRGQQWRLAEGGVMQSKGDEKEKLWERKEKCGEKESGRRKKWVYGLKWCYVVA